MTHRGARRAELESASPCEIVTFWKMENASLAFSSTRVGAPEFTAGKCSAGPPHERAETLLPHELKRSEVSRNISYRFLRMGGTGYQPVLVGNLPTRRERTVC